MIPVGEVEEVEEDEEDDRILDGVDVDGRRDEVVVWEGRAIHH